VFPIFSLTPPTFFLSRLAIIVKGCWFDPFHSCAYYEPMNEAHISLIMAHNPFLRVAQLDHVHKDYDKPDDSEKVPDKQAMHAEEPAAAQSQILQLNSLTKWQKKNG
jgi:hypothetical protein